MRPQRRDNFRRGYVHRDETMRNRCPGRQIARRIPGQRANRTAGSGVKALVAASTQEITAKGQQTNKATDGPRFPAQRMRWQQRRGHAPNARCMYIDFEKKEKKKPNNGCECRMREPKTHSTTEDALKGARACRWAPQTGDGRVADRPKASRQRTRKRL